MSKYPEERRAKCYECIAICVIIGMLREHCCSNNEAELADIL